MNEKVHSFSRDFLKKKKKNTLGDLRASAMAQQVKNPPAMKETQEMWVRSLGWEEPLERAWQSTPVFLPGESYRESSLAGHSPWGRKQLDMTDRLNT